MPIMAKKNKRRIGLALYPNEDFNFNKLNSKIINEIDFLHIDIVDKSFNINCKKNDLLIINDICKKWEKKLIQFHIMSKDPLKYIKKNLVDNCKIETIFVHDNIENLRGIKNKILEIGLKPGIVISPKNYKSKINIELLKEYNEILLLCIQKPGESGQEQKPNIHKFVDKLNLLKKKYNIKVTVDGGINISNIGMIKSDNFVSSSYIMNSDKPSAVINKLKLIVNGNK